MTDQRQLRMTLEKGMITVPFGRKTIYVNDLQKYVVLGIGCFQISRGMRGISFDRERWEYNEYRDGSYREGTGLWIPVPGTERVLVDSNLRRVLEQKKLVWFDRKTDMYSEARSFTIGLEQQGWAVFGACIGQYSAEVAAGRILDDFKTDDYNPAEPEDDEDETHADLGRFAGIF